MSSAEPSQALPNLAWLEHELRRGKPCLRLVDFQGHILNDIEPCDHSGADLPFGWKDVIAA